MIWSENSTKDLSFIKQSLTRMKSEVKEKDGDKEIESEDEIENQITEAKEIAYKDFEDDPDARVGTIRAQVSAMLMTG